MPLAVRFFIAIVAIVILLSLIIWVARRILARAFPAAKAQPKSGGSYYAGLRFTSFLLRAVGSLSIVFSLIILLVGINAGQQIGINVGYPGGPFVTSILISISAFFFMWGLFVLAFGEVLKVLVDIALNTAPLPNIAAD